MGDGARMDLLVPSKGVGGRVGRGAVGAGERSSFFVYGHHVLVQVLQGEGVVRKLNRP